MIIGEYLHIWRLSEYRAQNIIEKHRQGTL